MQHNMYKIIKKQNGEKFAKAIRNYDNAIFDIPNIDKIVKYAGKEAEPIMSYLVSLKNIEINETNITGSPIEILKKAGYNAYYADTFEKQNDISKYFKDNERLCTFRDERRCQDYYIINCIKENVNEVSRESFKHPSRQDDYGTSVISIQILKSGGFISIKNRYNHTVENPDNTFNSNPDNIILGLSQSLRDYFNVDFSSSHISLPDNYIKIKDNIYKYNHEYYNVYYGENFYIKNGKIIELSNDKIVLDNFILDWKTKKIIIGDESDGFLKAIEDEIKNKKLRVILNEKGNKVLLANNEPIIETKNGKIISIHFRDVKKIKSNFLVNSTYVESIILDKTEEIGSHFLENAYNLNSFTGNNLKVIGNNFLANNYNLTSLFLPLVENIDNAFLKNNEVLSFMSANSLKEIGNDFLYMNQKLENLTLKNLIKVGENFISNNKCLSYFSADKLKHTGDCFFNSNITIENISLPMLETANSWFLWSNRNIKTAFFPKLVNIGIGFMQNSHNLSVLIINTTENKADKYFLKTNYNKDHLLKKSIKKRCSLDSIKYQYATLQRD